MNKQRVIQIIVVMFFVGLLLVPTVMKQFENWRVEEAPDNADEIIDRYGFYLEEVSNEIGVDFTHVRPELDSKIEHINPQIAAVGASVSVSDVNNDGYPDFYLTNSEYGTQNALYINQGDGTFEDRAGEMGVADLNIDGSGVSMGSVWGDLNNDGFEDLIVY